MFTLGSVSAGSSIGAALNGFTGEAGGVVLDAAQRVVDGATADQAIRSSLASFLIGNVAGAGIVVGAATATRALLFAGETVVGYAKVASGIVLPGTVISRSRLIPGVAGKILGGSSTTLKRNLLRSSGINVSIPATGFQAHHIIPTQLGRQGHPILKKIGFNLDDATNGILLPARIHRTNHPAYTSAIEEALDRIPSSASLQRQMEMVYEIQAKAVRAFSELGASLSPPRTTFEEWQRILL